MDDSTKDLQERQAPGKAWTWEHRAPTEGTSRGSHTAGDARLHSADAVHEPAGLHETGGD